MPFTLVLNLFFLLPLVLFFLKTPLVLNLSIGQFFLGLRIGQLLLFFYTISTSKFDSAKCWQDLPGYHQFVTDKWSSLTIDGWGGFVLKEKLRLIKSALKEWHLTHSTNIPAKLDSLKARLSSLDGRSADGVLSPVEIEELRGTTHEIHSLSRVNTSICWQQSQLLWLKEGDANSKFFHSVLASRRRRNAIVSFVENGNVVEGVQPVCNAIFTHFSNHYKNQQAFRPGVGNLNFKSLTVAEGGSLVLPFTVDEVKAAV